MSDETNETSTTDAVQLFIQGAKTLHVGYFLDKRSIEDKGFKLIKKAIETIDALSTNGRDILLPLLDEEDEGVRAVTASGLWQSHYDRALSVLIDLQNFGITEASRFARVFLTFRGQVNPCGSDPRFPSLYGKEGNERDGAIAALRSKLPPLGLPRRTGGESGGRQS